MQECSISPVSKKSPTHTPSLTSVAKTLIVDALGMILAWKPRLALLLGRFIGWVFPWLRGA